MGYVKEKREWMNKYIRCLLSLFIIVLSGVLSGCETGVAELGGISDNNMEEAEERYREEISEVNSVGIYVDATPSMEGYIGWHMESTNKKYPCATEEQLNDFISLVPLTVYRRCLQQINMNINSIFTAEEKLRFYCADTTLWQTEKNVLEEAEKYTFYRDSNNKKGYTMVEEFADKYTGWYSTPSISFAINNTVKEDFSIVITDLYENESNSIALIQQLKKIRARKGKQVSIGILGIKSEFAGRIYDIAGCPPQNYGVVGKTENLTQEDIKFRPFYVIMIGDKEKIEVLFDAFYQGIDVDSIQIEKALFSDSEVRGLDYNDYAGFGTNNDSHIYTSNINIFNKGEETKLELINMESKDLKNFERIYLLYDISSDSLKNYLKNKKGESRELTISEMKVRGEVIEDCIWEETQILSYKETEGFGNEKIKEAMKVENIYILEEENQIAVECRFDKNAIEGGIYKFSGKIMIKEQNAADKWIHEWNSSKNILEGEKTHNLNNYYNAIRNTFSTDAQNILNFSFYFKILK